MKKLNEAGEKELTAILIELLVRNKNISDILLIAEHHNESIDSHKPLKIDSSFFQTGYPAWVTLKKEWFAR